MGLADTFQRIVDSLPEDWTDLELDMRLTDESRYVEAASYLVTCNARPYSHYDWHWRLLIAHTFGHAAAAQTVHGTLALLDDAGIEREATEKVVDFLLYYGVLGVKVGGNEYFIFTVNCDLKVLKIRAQRGDEETRYSVNPAFWPAFGITCTG